MKMLGNLVRSTLIISIAGLIGWYNYETNGLIGVIANACFLALGILLVSTWKQIESKESDPIEVIDAEEFFQRIDERIELYMEARDSEVED